MNCLSYIYYYKLSLAELGGDKFLKIPTKFLQWQNIATSIFYCYLPFIIRGCHGHMVGGFTTTKAISAYHY